MRPPWRTRTAKAALIGWVSSGRGDEQEGGLLTRRSLRAENPIERRSGQPVTGAVEQLDAAVPVQRARVGGSVGQDEIDVRVTLTGIPVLRVT